MKLLTISEIVDRRQFLKQASAGLTAMGVGPNTLANFAQGAAQGAKPAVLWLTATTTGRYEPNVKDSLSQTISAFNFIKKINPNAVIKMHKHDGEELILLTKVDQNTIAKLSEKFGVEDDFGEDGLYFDKISGGIDSFEKSHFEDNNFTYTIKNLSELIKGWWEDWEAFGTGYLDEQTFRLLKSKGIDPVRVNLQDEIGYNRSEEREEETGSSELEDWENKALADKDERVESEPIQHYPGGSAMHQPFENKLARALNLVEMTGPEPSLDAIGRFPSTLWMDDSGTAEEQLNDFFTNPPPGIAPINAKIVQYGEPDEEGFIKIIAQMTLEDYVRNSIEYDQEPYYVLEQVKEHMGSEFAKIAHKFMSDPNSGLRIARIGSDGDGGITDDNWPTTPEL